MIIKIKGSYVVFLYLMICSLYLFSPVFATSFADEKQAKKEVTVITSQTLTADNKAKTALFEGSVVAKKGEMTLFADKMLVYYSDEKGTSNIKKIESEGHVKLLKEGRVVTSQSATYFTEPEEKAIFTGEPKITDGENVVTGTTMTYFMKDDRSIVENAKVFLVNKDKQ
ncbi:MAG: LptA/OstA family protein [Dissulfurispiraceae bacterium]